MLALPICVSACLRMQVPESIFPASESFLDKESGGTVTKMVPFVLDGPRYVDGSQEYAIWVSGAPISQDEATFSQPHGAISSDFGKERAFLQSRNIRGAASTANGHVCEEVERIYIGDNMQTEPPSVIFVQILVGAGDWIEWNVCAVNSLGDAGEPSPRCESMHACMCHAEGDMLYR